MTTYTYPHNYKCTRATGEGWGGRVGRDTHSTHNENYSFIKHEVEYAEAEGKSEMTMCAPCTCYRCPSMPMWNFFPSSFAPPFFSFSCFLLLSSFQPLSFCVSLSAFLFLSFSVISFWFFLFRSRADCFRSFFVAVFHVSICCCWTQFQFSNSPIYLFCFFSFSYSRMDQRIRYYCNSQAQRHVLASLKAEANQRQRRQFWVSLILHLLLIFLPFFIECLPFNQTSKSSRSRKTTR